MTSELTIHPASIDELRQAHANVFDIWSKGLPLEEHVRSRLESPSHRRARWWVGECDGQVVVSLGAYPVHFHLRGEIVPGVAIGSVYTRSEYRGRGFAPRLLTVVEEEAKARHVALAILYSDINPDYYARLGYVLCPSWSGWRGLDDLPAAADDWRLEEITPQDHLPRLMRLYDGYHGRAPVAFARNREYTEAMLQKFARDRFYALSAGGSWQGYVRVGINDGIWRITDYALATDRPELVEALYAALAQLAARSGAVRVGGWLPKEPLAEKCFQLEPRNTEITMVKSLAWRGTIDGQIVAATNRFCEIDHV